MITKVAQKEGKFYWTFRGNGLGSAALLVYKLDITIK